MNEISRFYIKRTGITNSPPSQSQIEFNIALVLGCLLEKGERGQRIQGTGLTRTIHSTKDVPLSVLSTLPLGKENIGKSIRSNACRVALTVSKPSLHRHKIPVGLREQTAHWH